MCEGPETPGHCPADCPDSCDDGLCTGEEDYDNGKILITSPLAQGLVDKKIGDRVEIDVPQGVLKFEILDIRNEQ